MIPSGPEALIVLAVVILLFGARRLPELAKSMGASMKEFRKAAHDSAVDDGEDGIS